MVREIRMCTVLGWVQGWWSVTGLAIEIAGFSALSLDVAREYGRHRTVERYRAGAAAAQRLVDAGSSSDDAEPPVTAESSSADAERVFAKDLRDLQERNEAMIDRGSAMLAWYHSLSKSERKNYDPYSHNFFEIAASLPIQADRIAARPYRRAPIRFGIFLVLVGATLQMVGSWPCG
jgi:hypothetical protein